MKIRFLLLGRAPALLALALISPDGRCAVDYPPKPPPELANIVYGPTPANRLDVWLAKSDRPTPALIYFHGGGFLVGSKANLPEPLLAAALRAGITVVAVDYRMAPAVLLPTPYLDSARAVQYTRYKAKAWNIDPDRLALTGSSAGGATSLWIAFHDDLANPKSSDPVERESTRVRCAAVMIAQPSYDPRLIRNLVGEAAARHPLFLKDYGLKPDEVDTPKAYAMYREAAPVTYLTPDDPPVFAAYGGSLAPVPANSRAGFGIHHPMLGVYLKERMDAVHVPCELWLRGDPGNPTEAAIAFLRRHLR